jgi:hypothetical protein
VHDEHRTASVRRLIDEVDEAIVVVVFVYAQATLDRDRDIHRGHHRGHALGDKGRFAHQAGTEAPGLDPDRRGSRS